MNKVHNFAVAIDINKKQLEASVFQWFDDLIKSQKDLVKLQPTYNRKTQVEVEGSQDPKALTNLFRDISSYLKGQIKNGESVNIETVISNGGEVVPGNKAYHHGIAIEGQDELANYGAMLQKAFGTRLWKRNNLTTLDDGLTILKSIARNPQYQSDLKDNQYMAHCICTKGLGLQSGIYESSTQDVKDHHNGEYGHEPIPYREKYELIEGPARQDPKTNQLGTAEPYLCIADGMGIEPLLKNLYSLKDDDSKLQNIVDLLNRDGISLNLSDLQSAFNRFPFQSMTNKEFYDLSAETNNVAILSLSQFQAMRFAHFIAASIKKEIGNRKSVFLTIGGEGTRSILKCSNLNLAQVKFIQTLSKELEDIKINSQILTSDEEPTMHGADQLAKNLLYARLNPVS